MYCLKCGTQIPNEARFCPNCGEPVQVSSNTEPFSYQPLAGIDRVQGIGGNQGKQRKKSKVIWIASAGVLLCAALIFAWIEIPKATHYKEAIALMDSGNAMQAKEEFSELGKYKKSVDLSKDCQNILDFDAAKAQMEAGEFESAKQEFEKLGDYEQAPTMVEECQKGIDYTKAVALMDSDKNKEARDAFLKLGNYEDASQLAAECGKKLDYDAAAALMDKGNYEQALAAFTALANFSDAAEQAEECQNKIDYDTAVTAFNQGSFYTAYIKFTGLGGYADSSARARACIQKYPANGELYRNSDFSSKSCLLTISTADDGNATYLKFYTANDVLVATMFIDSGKKARIKLPVGTYKIKEANGRQWFGEEEIFGDDGYYQVLTFENNSETTSFKSNYSYTLKLRSGSEGNVGTENTDRNNF